MKLFILILSWTVLIDADQEPPSNFESRFDGEEPPTLKPADYPDVINLPGLRQKSRPKLSFKYEQRRFLDVPHVEGKKENTRHFFRVRKPVQRRKIFHISRQNDSLPQTDQVIDKSTTESKLREYLLKNGTIEDKRYDYILDKLPEAWAVPQDTIVPLAQEINNDEVDIPTTDSQITALNQISSALPEIKPLVQNKEYYGSDTESEVKNSQLEKTSHNITEAMDSNNIRAHYSNLVNDTTTPVSTTPWIKILIMSDGGLKWEINGTVEHFPKVLLEEIIIEDFPNKNITEDSPTLTFPESDINILNERDINTYTIYSTPYSTSSSEITEKNPASSDISIPPESSSESRLEVINNRLLSYSSNKALDVVVPNISSRRNDPHNVQDYTTIKMEDLISPILPTRRHRRRKHGRKKSTTITDVFTDITTIVSTTIGYEPELSKVSSTHNPFSHRQDFRRRNTVDLVSKAAENLTSGSENLNSTVNINSYTQTRGKPKYRKWNRNRNITPTVMNPHIVASNITEAIGNIPSSQATLPKTLVGVITDTDNKAQDVDFSTVEAQVSSAAALSPEELPTIKSNLPRMRFRNRIRKIKTTTQSAPSKSDLIETTEGATTEVKEDNGYTTASKPSTENKFKHPPPPPPTLSPWSDGFGK